MTNMLPKSQNQMLWFSSSGVPQRRVSSEACWHSFQCSWKLSQVGLLWQFATRRSSHLTTWNTNFWLRYSQNKEGSRFLQKMLEDVLATETSLEHTTVFVEATSGKMGWVSMKHATAMTTWCGMVQPFFVEKTALQVYGLSSGIQITTNIPSFLRLFFFQDIFRPLFVVTRKSRFFEVALWGRGFWWHSPCMNTPSFSSALAMQSRGPPKDWTIGSWKFDFFKKFQGSSDPFKSTRVLFIWRALSTNQKMFRNPGDLVWDPGDCSNGWRPTALAWWTSMNISFSPKQDSKWYEKSRSDLLQPPHIQSSVL